MRSRLPLVVGAALTAMVTVHCVGENPASVTVVQNEDASTPGLDATTPPPVDSGTVTDSGGDADAGPPDEIIDVTAATSDNINLGFAHICALYESGAVYCWGDNARGQLGVPVAATPKSPKPVKVQGLDDAAKISAGGLATCAIRKTGAIVCWGDNSSGQLGVPLGTTGPFTPQPSAVVGLPAVNAHNVGTGLTGVCTSLNDGQTWCWGSDGLGGGSVGADAGSGPQPTPRRVAPTISTTEVHPFMTHTCAVTSAGGGALSGEVWCWGYNFQGELGFAPAGALAPYAPVAVTNAFNANSSLTTNVVSTCTIRSGNVVCWGKGTSGELGGIQSFNPSVVSGWNSGNVKQVHMSPALSCAVKNDSTVECIGNNDAQQLGRAVSPGASASVPAPVQGIFDAVRVTTGTTVACALRKKTGERARVSCWGTNEHGLLGNNTPPQNGGGFIISAVPVDVALP